MDLPGQEYQTLQDAIAALQATAGLKTVEVDVRPLPTNQPNPRADALLTITINGIYSIICGSKRVVRGMGFIKKGTAIFALSFRHGKIYQPMCL